MSLLAWYPLNGDTKDYSGNNNDLINNGLQINNEGKIGQCYKFDNDNYAMKENVEMKNIRNEFTICLWAKLDTPNNYQTMISLGRSGITIDTYDTRVRAFLYETYMGASSLLEGNFPNSKWTHIAFSCKNKIMSLYIDGNKVSETKAVTPLIEKIDKIYLGTRDYVNKNFFMGYLNDIRIYDEALTAIQIKEIAQAKICHLSLNENIQPRKNLLTDKHILKRGSFPTIFGKDEIGNYFIKTKDSGYYDGIWINYLPIDANAYYTVSFEIWCEKSFSLKYDFNISADGQSSNDFPRAQELAINGWDYDTPYQWKKFAMRSIAKPDMKNTKLFDTIAGYGTDYTSMLGTKIYYRNIMVEKKDRWAPYIENEQAISLINIDNSWKLPIPVTATHEFPKYEDNSFKFNKYSSITTNIQLTDEMIANANSQMTISIWIKPTTAPTQDSYGIIVGKAGYQGIGLGFKKRDTNSIYVYAYHRLNGGDNITTTINDVTSIKLNTWTHLVARLNKSTEIISLYVNGEKLSENNCSQGNRTIDGPIQIGGLQEPWGTGPFDSFQGYMKDCRIYTTALSDEDIKLLYQPEIIIDKANTIRCNEINERILNPVGEEVVGIDKKAILNFNEFSEIPDITSGVHNLKLGNDILPVLIDMDNDGGRWARIFYHNNHSGTVLFSNDNDWAEARETNTNAPTTSDKYSILSKLEYFRQNTNCYFELKLKYPTLAPNEQNIWKQKSNPTFEAVKNYKPINISWTSQGWGGLERSSLSSRNDDTFIDGTVNHFNWFYAIGAKTSWQEGIPAWDVPVMDVVELWIRINDFDLFTDINQEIAINSKTLTAKEFKEIY